MKLWGLTAGLFGIDYLLKEGIEAQKAEDFPRDLEGTGGRIRLYRNHNRGFCFGFLKENQALVRQLPLVFTSASAGIFAWLAARREGHFLERLGFSFITAGALSNLFDRLKRGYVVDYFSFRIKYLEKVVFNLGDLFILAGSLFLAVSDAAASLRRRESGTARTAERRWPWQRQRSPE